MMITAGVLALGLATWTPSKAQGPLYDRVKVNLPYSVTIGERTLQPGDYVIQQLRDQGGGSRVLLIYSDSGMKFETSAMTIPALDNRTPEDTKVILHHFGNDYYFDKVWIQGKDYGYEFPLPDAVKSRERERAQPISVAANYSTVQQTESASTTTTTTSTDTAANTAATTRQTTTPAAAGQTTTSAATSGQTTLGQHADANQSTTQSATTTQRTMTAQSQTTMPPATTQSQATMQPSTTTSRSTASAADQSATSGSADRSKPNTAAGWVMMLLSGGALSGAGLALRRRR
jgi:hypothetical protein